MLNDFLAYGIDNHPIESVMRIQAVKRWHMIDTTRIQNLAEHSANVALLVMLIVRTAPMNDGSSHSIEWIFPSTGEAVMAALVHDLAEAFTGDIPTHSKRHLQGIARMEAGVVHPVFNMHVNLHTAKLIKICDLADGIRFIRIHGVDATARHAQKGLEEQLTAKFKDVRADLNGLLIGWPENIYNHVHSLVTFYAYESPRA